MSPPLIQFFSRFRAGQVVAPRSRRTPPRGSALPKVLAIVVIGGAIWAYKFTSAPASLLARFRPQASSAAPSVNQKEFLESLGRLIGQSHQVMAIHGRGATPYVEIVLWKDDALNPGVIDATEIAVISQSLVTQSISVYTAEPHVRGDSTRPPVNASAPRRSAQKSTSHAGSPAPAQPGAGALAPGELVTSRAQSLLNTPLTPGLLAQPSFCDRWRVSPQVRSQVIATGLSDLIVEQLGPEGNELSLLRLTLRWSHNSADGHPEQEQSVLVKPEVRDQESDVSDQNSEVNG